MERNRNPSRHAESTQLFGDVLREVRRAAGLTQEELAERARLSPRGLSDLERGVNRFPRRETLLALAEALTLSDADRARLFAAARRRPSATDTPSLQPRASMKQQATEGLLGAEAHEPTWPVGGYLGAQPEHPLVARDQELAVLLRALADVVGGAGRLVFLVGEAGVGKTRLAQEVAQAARDRAFLIATGRCYAPQEHVPYFPFLEALSRAYAVAPRALQATLPEQWPEAGRLIPDRSMQDRASALGPASGSQEDQQRLFWHVTGFLQALARERPLVLLFDDLHWADGASLGLIAHLARHTASARILYMGTYRDTETPPLHPLARTVRDLCRERVAERIEVRRFAPEGTAAFVATILGTDAISVSVSRLVHGPTEGNAFFAQEMLRTLVERGDVARVDGVWQRHEIIELAVPENVKMTILERVSRLSLPAQEMLAVASVLGQAFTFDDLLSTRPLASQPGQDRAGAAAPDESDAETALEAAVDEAVGAALLREAGRDGYTFSHVLTQRAIYEYLPSRRRRRLHRAAAETIERAPETERTRRVAEVAYHFVQADEPARAIPFVLRSGAQAEAVYANDEAARQYQLAIELARGLGDRARESESLERLASLHWFNTGDYHAALVTLEQAAQLYRSLGNRQGELQSAALLARACARCRRPQDGRALLTRLLPGAPGAPVESQLPAIHAALLTALADVDFHCGAYSEQLAAAAEAAELWRATGNVRSLVDARCLHGIALRLLGRWDEALEELSEVASLADGAERLGTLYMSAHASYHRAYAYLQAGQMETARASVRRSVERSDRAGNVAIYGAARFLLGWHAFYVGEWDTARLWFDRTTQALEGTAYTIHVYAPFANGVIQSVTGEVEVGREALREAIALAQHTGFLFCSHRAHRELAEVELVLGLADDVRMRLEPLVESPGSEELNDITPLLPMLAWAYLELGQDARAETLLEQGFQRAKRQHHQLALVDLRRIQGVLCMKHQRWQEAEAALEASLALARAMPFPYAEAKALYLLGNLHTLRSEPDHLARAAYEQALAICARLGERLYAEQIEQAMVAIEGEGRRS